MKKCLQYFNNMQTTTKRLSVRFLFMNLKICGALTKRTSQLLRKKKKSGRGRAPRRIPKSLVKLALPIILYKKNNNIINV